LHGTPLISYQLMEQKNYESKWSNFIEN